MVSGSIVLKKQLPEAVWEVCSVTVGEGHTFRHIISALFFPGFFCSFLKTILHKNKKNESLGKCLMIYILCSYDNYT